MKMILPFLQITSVGIMYGTMIYKIIVSYIILSSLCYTFRDNINSQNYLLVKNPGFFI